jgi:nucleoside-diphosphate-sugar epimerase
MSEVLVAGATGRVARAVLPELARLGVHARIAPRDATDDELVELAIGTIAVLNLAGRAHLARNSDTDLAQLHAANVELPLRLLRVATTGGVRFVHLSSTKAGAKDLSANPYARSKAEAEALLAEAAHASGCAPVVAFRTCAVMAPPYDAGKLSLLRRLTWMPSRLVPARRVPVVDAGELARLLRATLEVPPVERFAVVEVPPESQMSLRDVVAALRAQR